MNSTGSSNGMTQRYLRKREAVLTAAAGLFNQRGVKGATLCDVASQVGLSTNSITYYYKKKEDLVVACLLRSIEAINAIIASAQAMPSAQARIREFIGLFFARLAQVQKGESSELMSFRDVHVLASPHAEVVFEAYTGMFRQVRRLLITDTLTLENRLPLNARAHLLLTVALSAMAWSGRYAPEDFALVAERICDLLIGGMAGPRAAWGASPLDARLDEPAEADDSTQEAFLRSATALINDLGYGGASVERISAKLNVTKGSFYHHNLNKEELISACFERTFGVMRREQALVMKSEGSGWDKLCALARALVRYQYSEKGPLLRITAWSELPEDIRQDKQNTTHQLSQRIVGLLVDGMKDGSVRALDQAIAASLVTSMINASVTLDRWVAGLDAESAIELFVRPLFVGILSE